MIGSTVLHGGREFLAVHQEIAVAADGDHGACGIQPLHRHRRRQAIAHRAGGRRDLGGEVAEAVEAVDPAGEVAGAVAEDGVVGGRLSRSHTMISPRLTPPGCGGRLLGPGEIIRVGRLGLGAPARLGGWRKPGRCQRERRRRWHEWPDAAGRRGRVPRRRDGHGPGSSAASECQTACSPATAFRRAARRPAMTRSAALTRASSFGLGPMPRSPA